MVHWKKSDPQDEGVGGCVFGMILGAGLIILFLICAYYCRI